MNPEGEKQSRKGISFTSELQKNVGRESCMGEMIERIAEFNEDALTADGFDDAIIGIVNQGGTSNYLVLYDSEKCIEILAQQFEEDGEEESDGNDFYTMAVEYFEFNVSGGYVGENTPMFLTRLDEY